ncbi:hypothetical protein HanRHA438_Chr06g0272621 [Helianthus annuus]|nr:hypothetical protein HanHA300_Chr06g0216021 [Helianthus annuus]KAJ0573887.1 hypothetical protein HanHA89_Chr06g0231831 [Helianthus annuus]KAJ0738223.1 hypothetical protein HanLR1_Chr06g0215771 [Helianthus annuus]KAJ0912291.1 hypothetical protein HanRHA438_Chr06g0272621 [Helianthus annuus]
MGYSQMSWSLQYRASNQSVQNSFGGTRGVYKRLNSYWWTILFSKAQCWVIKQRVMAQIMANCSSLMPNFGLLVYTSRRPK